MTFKDAMWKYWARVVWNFKHIFDTRSNNPFILYGEDGFTGAERTGWEDLFHSIKNLTKEAWRKRDLLRGK